MMISRSEKDSLRGAVQHPLRGCRTAPLRESFSDQLIIIAAHAFPNPSGQISNYCRFHLARILLQSEAISHWTINYFARLAFAWYYMAGRFVSVITKICVL